MRLHIDLETFSSEPLKRGIHKYVSSPDFHIQLMAYQLDEGQILQVDFENGETVPQGVKDMLNDPGVAKVAFNAVFEIACLHKAGYLNTPNPIDWFCVMVKALALGLPAKLSTLTHAIDLDIHKAPEGDKLVHFFSKPTAAGVTHSPLVFVDKWDDYKYYNRQDVAVEKALDDVLKVPVDWDLWRINNIINNTGFRIDQHLCRNVQAIHCKNAVVLMEESKELTGLENPNSVAQLKPWLETRTIWGIIVDSLDKETVASLLSRDDLDAETRTVLENRQLLSMSSIAKYRSLTDSAVDGRVHDTLFFYGGHTGRFSGRLFQPQNLPPTNLTHREIQQAKELIYAAEDPRYIFGDDVFKKLIRTAVIADPGKQICVSDFAAIEARVLAWIARESWVLDVFNTHGMLYEAQAARMFDKDIDQVSKADRNLGKKATLLLGYQGGPNALSRAGFDATDDEKLALVRAYRKANKEIVTFWYELDSLVREVIETKRPRFCSVGKIRIFIYSKDCREWLVFRLPSKRYMFYYSPEIVEGKITYMGINSVTKQWERTTTYGGKLTENIVQAIACDILCEKIKLLYLAGADILFHVHDEIVCQSITLGFLLELMSKPVTWAYDLPLKAEGFACLYYMKE